MDMLISGPVKRELAGNPALAISVRALVFKLSSKEPGPLRRKKALAREQYRLANPTAVSLLANCIRLSCSLI